MSAPREIVPKFYRVSPRYWMKRTWSDDARLLGLYLLTSPHRNLEGLFWCPRAYMSGDLQWLPERLAQPLAELRADGFLKYDDAGEVALLPKALKYNRPANPNMITAILRAIMTVPETSLDADFLASAEKYCEPLAERLRERFPERFAKHLLSTTTTTPSNSPPPVDNSPDCGQPVQNAERQSEGEEGRTDEQAPPKPRRSLKCPTVPETVTRAGVRSDVAAIVGVAEAGEIYNPATPLGVAYHGLAAYLLEQAEQLLPCSEPAQIEDAARRMLNACIVRARRAHENKPIANLPAYLLAIVKKATAPGDACGDDVVEQIRAAARQGSAEPKRKSEPKKLGDILAANL